MFWHRPTHNLDESHDGQTITVNQGELILIKLPHSSVDQWGFGWPTGFTGNTVWHYGSASVGTNEQELQFYARSTGTEEIDLQRKQTPGNGNAVIKTFKVTINVN